MRILIIGDIVIIQGTPTYLAKKAASVLYDSTLRLLREKQNVVIAVPGGRSVAGIYKNFRGYSLPWNRVHMFLLDERLVAADHPDSNYRLVKEHMGGEMVPVWIHQFSYDTDSPVQSLINYKEELNRCGGRFDIVLASSGEDGHIASLFPNHHSLENDQHGFFLLDDSPKPPPRRMSASFTLIQQADTGVLLFFGSTKRKALERFLNAQQSSRDCPARIMTKLPRFYLLTDQEVKSYDT